MSLPLAVILRQKRDIFICLLIKYLLFFGLIYMIPSCFKDYCAEASTIEHLFEKKAEVNCLLGFAI